MKKLLVIVPAYNEAKNLPLLLGELKEFIGLTKTKNLEIEVLVINDCSKDDTSLNCRENGINVVDLPCNLGIGGAVQTGYKYAQKNDFDYAIQIDGDGQHDPSYILNLVEPLVSEEADLVIGSRYIDYKGFQSSLLRRMGIRFFTILIKSLSGKKITDPTSGYRACNKTLIHKFAEVYPKDYPEPESIMSCLRNGFFLKEVPVLMRERKEGVSSINIPKSIYYMFKVSLAIFIDWLRKDTLKQGA
ncbi:glycosyltransferase family 2 protein [Paenibacillus macerans]|uniref:glycosyltransferase family 2 protein n=1 Tax=Paenibacillus macerans TaxID=44252 RepID=UPI0022E37C25|nr:glycosyltransferase family 2 protein [Paenibacillus macerans]